MSVWKLLTFKLRQELLYNDSVPLWYLWFCLSSFDFLLSERISGVSPVIFSFTTLVISGCLRHRSDAIFGVIFCKFPFPPFFQCEVDISGQEKGMCGWKSGPYPLWPPWCTSALYHSAHCEHNGAPVHFTLWPLWPSVYFIIVPIVTTSDCAYCYHQWTAVVNRSM